jgi:hypothetical protein
MESGPSEIVIFRWLAAVGSWHRHERRNRGGTPTAIFAMTRAKDDLHLIVSQRFFTHGQSTQGDRHVYAARTRFIPDRLLGLFEKTTWPSA